MKIYRVGGAVRDALLGLPAGDTDWVVVGASPEEMAERGYTPVGRDFPVFLHPVTHEEYALARTERKTARGYHGFAFNSAPDVTLEEDLARRDLTINAIAQDEEGRLVDPFGGQDDLRSRTLRHVSDAFAEDPVRILRLARLAARFSDFSVAPETMALMRSMVAAGEVDALVPERSWRELARGLMTGRPSRMFGILRECGALARIVPELDAQATGADDDGFSASLRAADAAAAAGQPLEVRLAALCARLAPDPAGAVEAIAARLRVPSASRDLARLVARERDTILSAAGLPPPALASLLRRLDLYRRPERLDSVAAAVLATTADAHALETGPTAAPPWAARLREALAAASAVDAGAIAASAPDAATIASRVEQARIAAIARCIDAAGTNPARPDDHPR